METIEQVVERVKLSFWRHEYTKAYRVVEAGDLAIILHELERQTKLAAKLGQRCAVCRHRERSSDLCRLPVGTDGSTGGKIIWQDRSTPTNGLCDIGQFWPRQEAKAERSCATCGNFGAPDCPRQGKLCERWASVMHVERLLIHEADERVDALAAGAGAWTDANHPDLNTPEDMRRYLAAIRKHIEDACYPEAIRKMGEVPDAVD